ncbi:carboxylesterase family protein, partial [Myxococcota bacterium]|nr:carboxylesterase family protein [Myxococcota bacterium]
WLDFSALIGAGHGVEIPFVFGNFDFGPLTETVFPEPSRDAAQMLSGQMMSYWGSFARSGNPNPETSELPNWPAWQADLAQFLRFDSAADGGVSPSKDTASAKQILDGVSSDPRIESDDLRCRLYAQMTQRDGPLSAEEYPLIADGLCQNRPLADSL